MPRRLELTNKQSTRIDCDISICFEVVEGPEKWATVEHFMRVDTLGVHLPNTGPVEVIEVTSWPNSTKGKPDELCGFVVGVYSL